METPKISSKTPLSLATNFVLNPTKRQIAKTTSTIVAVRARNGIVESGNHGLMSDVCSTKLAQFPHTDNSMAQYPNRSINGQRFRRQR